MIFAPVPFKDPAKQKESARRHYEKNRQKMIDRARLDTDRRRREARAFVADYLSNHSCVDCGEADHLVLEFDHRDPSTKVAAIAQLVGRGCWSVQRLQTEIDKCDVRCTNCHRRRTRQQHQQGEIPRRRQASYLTKEYGRGKAVGTPSED